MVTRHTFALCALAAFAGFVAWMGPFWLLPVSLLLPVCWAAATNRWQAGLSVFTYHLMASRALPFGAATYFGAPVLGVCLWLVAALILALTWAVCWNSRRKARAFLLPVACVLVAFPPIGIIGWMHPITSAGCLFPGLAWFGLFLTLLLIVVLASMPLRYALGTTALAVAVAFILRTPPPGVAEWQSFETHFDCGVNRDFFRDFRRITSAKTMAADSTSRLVVFGESVGGLWTPSTQQLWENNRTTSVVFGCELPIGNAEKCDNTLIALDDSGARILYRQRMPVPVSLWRPWSTKGFRAHWFANPVVELDGYKVAPLICYEQILIWPILQSALHRPNVLLAVANDWWARDTTAPGIQINSARAWARLFGLHYVVAFNY